MASLASKPVPIDLRGRVETGNVRVTGSHFKEISGIESALGLRVTVEPIFRAWGASGNKVSGRLVGIVEKWGTFPGT